MSDKRTEHYRDSDFGVRFERASIPKDVATTSEHAGAVIEAPPKEYLDLDEKPLSFKTLLKNFIILYWRSSMILIFPILGLPIILNDYMFEQTDIREIKKFRLMYIVFILMGYWITDCIPIQMTGLMPMFMLPIFGIFTSMQTMMCYYTSITMNFVGCIFIGLTIENSGLNKRIALYLISKVGFHPRILHILVCITSMFLSFFLMSAAVVALMVPLITGLLFAYEKYGVCDKFNKVTPEERADPDKFPNPKNISKAYYIGVAYSSNAAQLSSLGGTYVVRSYMSMLTRFYGKEGHLNFLHWLLFNFPITILICIFIIFWLQFLYMGRFRPNSEDGQIYQKLIENREKVYAEAVEEYTSLNPINWHEGCVCFLIVFAIILWIFTLPFLFPDVKIWLPTETNLDLNMAQTTMFIVVLMFMIPSNIDFFKQPRIVSATKARKCVPALVSWPYLQARMNWGLSFVVGAGTCLAIAADHSGIFDWLKNQLYTFQDINHKNIVVCFLLFLQANYFTELSNNYAITDCFLHNVLKDLSTTMEVNPHLLGHAILLGASYSYMLPAGSIPNAILMAYGHIRTVDFLLAGTPIKLFAILITMLFLPTYGKLFWDFDTFPDWAGANKTG